MASRHERRAQPRLPLPLRLALEPLRGSGEGTIVERTWNVGAGGLYYVTRPELIPAASHLAFRLDAPNGVHHGFLPLHLHGRGEVLRVDEHERLPRGLVGVAVRFSRPLELMAFAEPGRTAV